MLQNYYHKSGVRKLRSVLRSLGILKVLKIILSKRQNEYEEFFLGALKKSVKLNDTVWDIGANVGLYTEPFLNWVGQNGTVVAFEPLPKALDVLNHKFKTDQTTKRLKIMGVALSDYCGEAVFVETDADGDIPVTSHILDKNEASNAGITVEVTTVDAIVQKEGFLIPNAVKIDVEGFEEDVLKGGVNTFSNFACKNILIEMHFTRMDERKLGDSASRIVNMLKDWGYKVTWVDASHLHASR
jgi:FkbM family methyltransferase